MPPERPTRTRNLWPKRMLTSARRLLIAGVAVLVFAAAFSWFVAGQPMAAASVSSVTDKVEVHRRDKIVVMSVNCEQGRGQSWHQMLTSKETLRNSCASIGEMLAEQDADVVCMQECDAPSWWSDGFPHAEAIAESVELSRCVQALNVDGGGLHYGTTLLSRFEIEDATTCTFPPTPHNSLISDSFEITVGSSE